MTNWLQLMDQIVAKTNGKIYRSVLTLPQIDENGWINCEEMFPEEGKCVLTWDGSYIRSAEILYQDKDSITWICGSICFENVTHWMPLPPPPG